MRGAEHNRSTPIGRFGDEDRDEERDEGPDDVLLSAASTPCFDVGSAAAWLSVAALSCSLEAPRAGG